MSRGEMTMWNAHKVSWLTALTLAVAGLARGQTIGDPAGTPMPMPAQAKKGEPEKRTPAHAQHASGDAQRKLSGALPTGYGSQTPDAATTPPAPSQPAPKAGITQLSPAPSSNTQVERHASKHGHVHGKARAEDGERRAQASGTASASGQERPARSRDVISLASLDPGSMRALQAKLHTLGFYQGPIDGVDGAATRRALSDYYRARGHAMKKGKLLAQDATELGLDPADVQRVRGEEEHANGKKRPAAPSSARGSHEAHHAVNTRKTDHARDREDAPGGP
jgi:hypothetical protein